MTSNVTCAHVDFTDYLGHIRFSWGPLDHPPQGWAPIGYLPQYFNHPYIKIKILYALKEYKDLNALNEIIVIKISKLKIFKNA